MSHCPPLFSPSSNGAPAATLRDLALQAIRASDPAHKSALARQLRVSALDPARSKATPVGIDLDLAEPQGLPGRPARPALLPHTRIKMRSVRSLEGRAALIHSITHIELNAIDLALDVVWRFTGMPAEFYLDWIQVADEEAQHFGLLRQHLNELGFDYGDFPAHHGLWEMAERTKGDLLARLGLVPRTLEARGLDASPAVKRKLLEAGDQRAGQILDIILRDEIGHVAIGNRWYRWVCQQRQLDPLTTFEQLTVQYQAPRPKGPLNLPARRAAGFTEEELIRLSAPIIADDMDR